MCIVIYDLVSYEISIFIFFIILTDVVADTQDCMLITPAAILVQI